MRYVLDFGQANAGGTPVFTNFKRLDTLAAVTEPAIVEISDGQYYFDLDWSTTTATSITFKAELAGIELSDVISSPDVVLPGATTASAGTSSLVGYQQVGYIVAKAGTDCGVLNLTPDQQASYDPFASSDPLVVQMLSQLNDLGAELVSFVNKHLIRECTFTTAASATSYALPADYIAPVDSTAWDRSGTMPLYGSVSPQEASTIKAWVGTALVQIPYRIMGNRLVFPVAPADGVDISLEYVSEYWVQTAASGTGPDADHVTASTDYVLFDPTLVIRGLKLKYREAKGFDTTMDYRHFATRLEWVMGKVGGSRVISMSGPNEYRSVLNIPDTGYGQ